MIHSLNNVQEVLSFELKKANLELLNLLQHKDKDSQDVVAKQYQVSELRLALALVKNDNQRTTLYETLLKRQGKGHISSEVSAIFRRKKYSWKNLIIIDLDEDNYNDRINGYLKCAWVDNHISRLFGDRKYFEERYKKVGAKNDKQE